MEKEFIPYETALALKKLGFDEECLYSFEYGNGGLECKLNPQLKTNSTCDIGEIVAPLYQQAYSWFREKYKIHIVINITIIDNWYFELYNLNDKRNAEIKTNQNEFKTYEEAELACLNKLIEIVKNGSRIN